MLGLNENTLTAIYVAVGIYLLYRLLFRKSALQEEYERMYEKVITSDKYKVKGQYNNDEPR